MLDREPTCATWGARLNQLTIWEHEVVKQYSCWCVNPDCERRGVKRNDVPKTVSLSNVRRPANK